MAVAQVAAAVTAAGLPLVPGLGWEMAALAEWGISAG
jgi:hypothetical protein